MQYPASSPYYTTDTVNGQFLDVWAGRSIFPDSTDQYWQITPTYNLRPDLLAYDLYSDGRLWWIFAARNPNALTDPLFGFTVGKSIYLPTLSALKAQLGF
jgi:hypothetical protein